jgi:hypothetical protein
MLSSDKASVRYDACELIRISEESSPELVTALVKATHDNNKDVAERANAALKADVHHQMAINVGIIKPKIIEFKNQQTNPSKNSMSMEGANIMQKWEYFVGFWQHGKGYFWGDHKFEKCSQMLNYAGEQGWELVSNGIFIDSSFSNAYTDYIDYYFKRPKP